MRGLLVAVAVCMMLVACSAFAGEVTKTVTIEKTCTAGACVAGGVCHPVLSAVVHPVQTVCNVACNVRERACARQACRAARRCACQSACEAPAQKEPTPAKKAEVNTAAPQKTVVYQRSVTRTWLRGGCCAGSCAK